VPVTTSEGERGGMGTRITGRIFEVGSPGLPNDPREKQGNGGEAERIDIFIFSWWTQGEWGRGKPKMAMAIFRELS